MVLKMALYKETYKLSNNFPGFTKIKKKLDLSTGLNTELEILDDNSVIFSNEKLKTSVEILLEPDLAISLFFAPRKKKYLEWSLLNVLNEYLLNPNKEIPSHINKKWNELTFLEKHFK